LPARRSSRWARGAQGSAIAERLVRELDAWCRRARIRLSQKSPALSSGPHEHDSDRALDVPLADDALAVVRNVGARCRFYKIGNELFTAAGPSVVERVRDTGARVFLDLKCTTSPTPCAAQRGRRRHSARVCSRSMVSGKRDDAPLQWKEQGISWESWLLPC
jgi:hypothetical protein